MNSILRRQFSSTVSLRNSSTTRVLSPIALPQAFFTPLVLPRTFFSYPIRTVKKSPVSSWFVLAGGWVFAIVTAGTLNYKLTNQKSNHLHSAVPVPVADQKTKHENGINEASPMRLKMEQFIKAKQSEIIAALETVDGKPFVIDSWTREHGGGGISGVLQDGNVFEKAGVNISIVYGKLPPAAVAKMRVDHKNIGNDSGKPLDFFAAGLSMVLHPKNPMAPTVHLNYRYFETEKEDGTPQAWWFGGGTDLTPSYLFDEDVIHFHKTIKEACDKHDKTYYPDFKKWCDSYFSVKHRNETRGVGGIFFDDLDDKDPEQLFAFVRDCLDSFLPSYLPIIEKRKNSEYTQAEKDWQQLRRGRYVEFNLVHDRGTSFGLNTPGARIESILMSLPLTARWQYMHEPQPGSREERLVSILKNPVEWV